jgi:hypothetical protein
MQEDWVNLGPDYVSNIPGYTSNNAFSASMDTIFDLYSYINGIFINLLQTSQISGYQIDLSLLHIQLSFKKNHLRDFPTDDFLSNSNIKCSLSSS